MTDRDRYQGGPAERIVHVRIIDRRADRRIMGAPALSHTVCGGPMTDRDISERDARNLGPRALDQWHVCAACREQLGPSPSPRPRRLGNSRLERSRRAIVQARTRARCDVCGGWIDIGGRCRLCENGR
jgi:hypothetical protein